MKKLLLLALFAVSTQLFATSNVTVKTYGVYKGKDATGKPICEKHATQVCVFKTYVVDDNSVFPLGILSATWLDPDTGNNVAISSVVQTYISATEYTLTFTYGSTWVGPFSINSADWSL